MRIILRGLGLVILLVMMLVLLNAAHAQVQRIGDECFEERTVTPTSTPKAAPKVKRKAPALVAGKPVRRTRFKHRVPPKPAAAKPAAPITKLFQVACPPNPAVAPDMVRKRAFVLPPMNAPVVVLPSQEFAMLQQLDVTRDWYADHVGPVPEPRFGVPIAGTLPLFILGAALIAWRRKEA